jgi:epoxyqueuosine reductase
MGGPVTSVVPGSRPPEPPHALEDQLKARAGTLGFDLVGITTLGPAETASHYEAWLEAGYAGEMHYLATGAAKRHDTRLPFPDVSSAIVVGMNYGGTQSPGPIARYARGDDYHDVMLDKLNALHSWLREETGQPIRGKAYVDTGPILERELARRAGLGWFGKNTNLIHPKLGSFFFIGALLVDLPLRADAPFEADRCGSCTRCLDACPTDAFTAPHTLDATRCISYLTIEQRGPIPEPLRQAMGTHVYGCDDCQDVCPWNVRFARDVQEPALVPRPSFDAPDIRDFMQHDDDSFRAQFRRSPIKRTKRRGLARNAAVVLGNHGTPHDLPALRNAAAHDPDPIVRDHAQWAIARIESRYAPYVADHTIDPQSLAPPTPTSDDKPQ